MYLIIPLSIICQAQDERFFREIFDTSNLKERYISRKIEVSTPRYLIDLNGDNEKESIRYELKDGLSYIKIYDKFGRKLLESKLQAIGWGGVSINCSFHNFLKITPFWLYTSIRAQFKQVIFKQVRSCTISRSKKITLKIYLSIPVLEFLKKLRGQKINTGDDVLQLI